MSPTPTLHLLCHVERIGPSYGTEHCYFSLNLTVGLSGADSLTQQQAAELLQPWRWHGWDWRAAAPPGLAVWGFIPEQQADKTWQQTNAQALAWEPVKAGVQFLEERPLEEREKLLVRVQQLFDLLWQDAEPGKFPLALSWETSREAETIEIEESADEDAKRAGSARPPVPWHATLAQLWAEPQPVPLLLRLTLFFRIANLTLQNAGVSHLVAAPCFPGTGAPLKVRAVPQQAGGELRGDTPDQLAYDWPYTQEDTSPLPDVHITAHLEPAAVAGPITSDSLINLQTLLVEAPAALQAAESAPEEHWQQRLPALFTDAFNLPRLLLDAAGLADLASLPELPLLVQAALHDRAHAGALRPPSDESLAGVFVRTHPQLAPAQNPAEFTWALEQHLLARTPGLADWITMLQENLPPEVTSQLTLAQTHHQLAQASQEHELTAAQDLTAALEALLQAVDQRLVLEKLVFAQWQKALTSSPPPALQQFWVAAAQQFQAFVQRPDVDVVRYLTQGVLQETWQRLPAVGGSSSSPVAALNDAGEVKQHLQHELEAYVRGRCNDASATDLYAEYRPALPAPWRALQASLTVAIEHRVAAICATYVGAAAETTTEYQSAFSAEPEGLVFQVDHTVRDVNAAAKTDSQRNDRQDVVRRVAGTLLLLRRKQGAVPNAGWHCANFAQLADAPTLGPVLVPNGYGYVDELRQAVLTYRNRPFGVPSAEDAIDQQVGLAAQDSATDLEDSATSYEPLLQHLPAYTGAPGSPKLPPLGYGREYEGLVGVISTAGALPTALADAVGGEPVPWRLKLAANGTIAPSDSLSSAIQRRNFLRRQPLGHLVTMRVPSNFSGVVTSQQRQTTALNPPTPYLPANVSPLARTLVPVDDKAMVVLLPGPDPKNPWTPEFARVQAFNFAVFRPSTPLEIWKRWVTADDSSLGNTPLVKSDTRKAVLTAYFRAQNTVDDAAAALLPDITLDDPAISHLHIWAERIWPPVAPGEPREQSTRSKQVPFPARHPTAPGALQWVQWDALQVILKAAAFDAGPAIAFDGLLQQVTVSVPEGQVWRLQLRPQVETAAARARFAPDLLDATGLPLQKSNKLDAGFQLLVEVASARTLPANPAQLLHCALRVREIPAEKGHPEGISIGLRSPDSATTGLLQAIHRVEILTQRWRWHGLPLQLPDKDNAPLGADSTPGFPFLQYFTATPHSPTNPAALEPFDPVLFATRGSDDFLLTPTAFSYDSEAAAEGQEVHLQPRVAMPGAQYHRFAIRAYHRYEGVMQRQYMYDSRFGEADPQNKGQLQAEQWQRHVYRCTFNQVVPPPVVHTLLPLTSGGYSLLVTGEGAFQSQVAGLAERLEAEIVSVAMPDAADRLLEMGPDPVLTANYAPIDTAVAGPQPLLGPVGHTFDVGSSIPGYTRASYFWQPPALQDAQGEDLDLTNFFVKVRFRRVIDPIGHANPANAPSLVSSWTPAFWTRILSPVDRVLLAYKGEAGVKRRMADVQKDFYFDQGTQCFRSTDAIRSEVVPYPAEPAYAPAAPGDNSVATGRLAHVFYALITERIADALGREDEAFHSMWLVKSQDSANKALRLRLPASLNNPVMRLIEIRFDHKEFKPLDFPIADEQNTALFDKLLPTSQQGERAAAMIVRITLPISIK